MIDNFRRAEGCSNALKNWICHQVDAPPHSASPVGVAMEGSSAAELQDGI